MENRYLIDILQYILKTLSVSVKRKDIYKILFSDPSYPSLASISSTLSYFGIRNNAFLTDIEHLKGLKNIFIHTREDHGHFYILKNISDESVILYDGKNKIISIKEFIQRWDGVILMLGKKTEVSFAPKTYPRNILMYVSFIAIILYCNFILPHNLAVTFLLDIAGLVCGYILLKQHLFEFNTSPLCRIGEKIDCNYVTKMNPFVRWLPFDLPILGIYFFLFDAISLFITRAQNIMTIGIYIGAVIFMLFLTIYQVLIVKKYCLYCLGLATLVVLKLAIVKSVYNEINLRTIAEFLVIAFITYFICFLFYKYINESKFLMNKEIALLKLKRNDNVIRLYFNMKSSYHFPADSILKFGRDDAKIKITTIVSLNCLHCRRVMEEASNLVRRFPNRFSWKLIIDGYTYDGITEERIIQYNSKQLHLYTIYEKNKDDCFRKLLSRHFRRELQISNNSLQRYKEMLSSIKEAMIKHYPTVLVNDIILPYEYDISDLQYIHPDITKTE